MGINEHTKNAKILDAPKQVSVDRLIEDRIMIDPRNQKIVIEYRAGCLVGETFKGVERRVFEVDGEDYVSLFADKFKDSNFFDIIRGIIKEDYTGGQGEATML